MLDFEIKEMPDEGSLEAVSVPMLLAQAWRDERSGLLQLAHGKTERRLEIRQGEPVSIESGGVEDEFARFLEDTHQIDPADRLAVEKMASERECPQASAVLALKLLDPKVLYRAMRRDARNRIAETFEWRAGYYRWTDALSEANPAAKPHDVLALFQEQLPLRWGTERLFESIMCVQNVYGDILPRYRKIAQKLARTGDHAARVIQRLDGCTPLGRVLGECAGDPLAAATLWTVLYSGVLRLTDGTSRIATEAGSLEFDVQVAVEAPVGEAVSPNAENEATSTPQRAGDTSADTLREEIESLLGQLSTLDHYSALGLDESAGAAQFKRAYFKAAKKYHPDSLARLGLEDLREPAALIFGRIAEAFETLSDPEKKAAYDTYGSQEPEIDTARLAQAETSFRKGEILAKMGNFDGALEYFEPAVDLWPEEPAYQAELGWALYKQPNADLERATLHLEIAMNQAPKEALIRFRLGLIMRARGETNRANELISKAREIDPSVEG
jgi:tetratricopeptide (TPR) repeat protein